MVMVHGRGKFASRSIITGLQKVLRVGGVKRAKALSPSTRKILPITLKGTAHLISVVASGRGACRTIVHLNIIASARSVDKAILSRAARLSIARRRLYAIIDSFIKSCVRIPPVCSTLGIGKGGLCRLTERNGAIRHGPEPMRFCRVRVLSVDFPLIHFHIAYDGKACVHALYRSVKRGLNYKTTVRDLLQAGINEFALSSTVALTRARRTIRGKVVRDGVLNVRRVLTRCPEMYYAGRKSELLTGKGPLMRTLISTRRGGK